jgi:hypothetical protein
MEVRMKTIRFAFGSLLFLMLFASASIAQQRTFISGLGSDMNSCSRAAPCRTFAQAILGTNAGGEVIVLDSAGYGPFTITKSVSIIAPQGVYAGISVLSGDGIDINAGVSDVVILRGLTINSQGGANGIMYNTGGKLHVENCVISGFSSGSGIILQSAGSLFVKDAIMRGNFAGIQVQPSSGTVSGSIDSVRLEGNAGNGLFVAGANVSIRNSVASGNGGGLKANNPSGTCELNIENCMVSNNREGVVADGFGGGAATVRISGSTVTNNEFGLRQLDVGVLLSRGNNTVEGNTNNTSGTIGSYTAK